MSPFIILSAVSKKKKFLKENLLYLWAHPPVIWKALRAQQAPISPLLPFSAELKLEAKQAQDIAASKLHRLFSAIAGSRLGSSFRRRIVALLVAQILEQTKQANEFLCYYQQARWKDRRSSQAKRCSSQREDFQKEQKSSQRRKNELENRSRKRVREEGNPYQVHAQLQERYRAINDLKKKELF